MKAKVFLFLVLVLAISLSQIDYILTSKIGGCAKAISLYASPLYNNPSSDSSIFSWAGWWQTFRVVDQWREWSYVYNVQDGLSLGWIHTSNLISASCK